MARWPLLVSKNRNWGIIRQLDGQRRILILTADVGFGHRSAANAIAEALREKYADRCLVEVVNPLDDERTPSLLRDSQTDYDKMVREMPDWYRVRYEISDTSLPNAIVENVFTVLLFKIMRDLILRFKPDVIITTHPMYPGPIHAVITVNKMNIPFFIVVTDLVDVHISWFHEGADLCLVPNEIAHQEAIKKYKLSPSQVKVTGIPVYPRFSLETRAKADLRQELGWQPDLTTVLAVGSKRVNNLEEILNVLNHSGLAIQIVAVAGGDRKLFRAFHEMVWHIPAYVYNYVENMPSFMVASDLIISKAGGLIITESLAAGLPMLFVDVTPGQEEGNAQFAIKNGAAELAVEPIQALETMCHWLLNDRALLTEYHERAVNLGRPQAAYDVADLAWKAATGGLGISPEAKATMFPKLIDLFTSLGSDDEFHTS